MAAKIYPFIVSSPDVRAGRPRISGTGITVHRVAIWYNLGHSAEEIAVQYPHLSLSGIFAALSFYFANRETIDTEIETDLKEADNLEAEFLSTALASS